MTKTIHGTNSSEIYQQHTASPCRLSPNKGIIGGMEVVVSGKTTSNPPDMFTE